jgi:biopolymer transport protein TolR
MAFGQLDGGGAPQPLSEINMTPLVDVMLVLLIVFIVTAPLLSHSVNINLPKADTKASALNSSITVSLNRDLQLYLDNAPVSREVLVNQLRLKIGKGEKPSVELHVDGAVAYQHVVSLMALVQEAGIGKLSFVTEPIKRR